MDRSVKAALLAVIGIILFLLAIVALPRTVASVIMDLDVPGEGAFAAIAFGAVTVGIAAAAWFWGTMVVRLLKPTADIDDADRLIEGANDHDLHER